MYSFTLKKLFGHLKTINHHKRLVMAGCFRVGLYKQGLLHDLSKYSLAELIPSVKYYCGTQSPHNIARQVEGYPSGWLHHKGRNKHHFEYWMDSSSDEKHPLVGVKMPVNYVVEMFIDRVSASKNYEKEKYTDASALRYYERGKSRMIIHKETQELLEKLLHMLADEGEEKTFRYIKEELLKKGY